MQLYPDPETLGEGGCALTQLYPDPETLGEGGCAHVGDDAGLVAGPDLHALTHLAPV
jgi:hypothetical protein